MQSTFPLKHDLSRFVHPDSELRLHAIVRARSRLERMRWPLVLAFSGFFLLALFPAQLLAQFSPGTITAFADATGSSCQLRDDSEKTFDIYIVNSVASEYGLAASRFRIAPSPGFSASYIDEVIPYPHSGNVQSGITVGYGTCLSGAILVGTVTYLGHGTSVPCSHIDVIGHPDSYYPPDIDVMDCSFDWLRASTLGALLVNPIGEQCAPWCTLATNAMTWGAIKALYR